MDRRIEKSKDSPIYKIGDFGFRATLKGSYVYRKNQCAGYSTPSGSHRSRVVFFYKHQIPSGLFLESIEADIQKGLAELKELM